MKAVIPRGTDRRSACFEILFIYLLFQIILLCGQSEGLSASLRLITGVNSNWKKLFLTIGKWLNGLKNFGNIPI